MPVPSRTIYPGEVLQANQFASKIFSVNAIAMQNYAMDTSQLVRMQVTRMLPVGKPVPLSSVRTADYVKRGQNVSTRFVAEGIEIQATLVAMQNGSAGDLIDARNPASGVIVKAVVKNDGTLSVGGR